MIEINGLYFNVEITRRSGMKYLRMRLRGNTILVSCSKFLPEAEIYRFIMEKKDWIYKAYYKSTLDKERSPMYRGGESFYIFGKPYRFLFSIGENSWSLSEDTLYLSYKEDDREKALRWLYKQLDRRLLQEAEAIMKEYLFLLQDYGYHQIPELKAKVLKSKWGVCYTRENRIAISSYLIHYPVKCLRYIILHEMTHFLVPNHSRRFYAIIQSHMPDYKEVMKQLK
ncbi:MAG: DUF45 domain-containing protein [Erysipelotrichaceae bacterium]|nr:DUF45 domain-containing protein [Erysipelotrichaceae bacterium]